MDSDRVEAVAALLRQAESAHATYEATELGGVYDAAWASWYAEYAVEHGLAETIGRPAPLDRVGPLLASAYADFEQRDPRPAPEKWADFVARRILEDL